MPRRCSAVPCGPRLALPAVGPVLALLGVVAGVSSLARAGGPAVPPNPVEPAVEGPGEAVSQAPLQAQETLTLPPWPDMMLRMRKAGEGVQNPGEPRESWRRVPVPEGALLAHLETRTLSGGDVQRVLVLDQNVEVWLRRDAIARHDGWTPGFGTLLRLPDGTEAPALARRDDGAAWVWTSDGTRWVEAATDVNPTDDDAPRPQVVVHVGDPIALDCPDEPLLDIGSDAALSVAAVGPAVVTGGTGGWVELTLASGIAGRAPARCGRDGDLIVSTLLPGQSVPRNAGRTLVHFWASWCRPCVAELPEFVVFQRSVGHQRAVAVSEDFQPISAERFLFDQGIEMPTLLDDKGRLLAELGGSQALPYTAILDEYGQVVDAWTGKTDWSAGELLIKLALAGPGPTPGGSDPAEPAPPELAPPAAPPAAGAEAAPIAWDGTDPGRPPEAEDPAGAPPPGEADPGEADPDATPEPEPASDESTHPMRRLLQRALDRLPDRNGG